MFDFAEFDKKVDSAALAQEVKEAPDFADVKKGDYIVSLEKMELTVTKQDQKPMFAAQFKIKEGDNKGRMLFFNRVIYGNKNTDKWNDGRAIKSVCTWINELLTEEDDPVEFVNYSDFAEQILDVFQMLQGNVEIAISYDPKSFNPVTINEVIDL